MKKERTEEIMKMEGRDKNNEKKEIERNNERRNREKQRKKRQEDKEKSAEKRRDLGRKEVEGMRRKEGRNKYRRK